MFRITAVRIAILLSIVNAFISFSYAQEDFRSQGNTWSELADRISDSVRAADYLKARKELTALGAAFSSSNLVDKNLTVTAIHKLSEMILTMDKSLNRITLREDEAIKVATQLQYAFDTVSHPNKPLWKDRYKSLKQKLNTIEKVVLEGNKKQISSAIQDFFGEYQLVYPAVVVAKSPNIIVQLDSLISFIRKASKAEIISSLKKLNPLIDALFVGSEREVVTLLYSLNHTPVAIPICWIGSFIIMILGIVSLKKYRSIRT